MKVLHLFVISSLTIGLLAACQSTNSTSDTDAASQPIDIRKGSSTEDLLTALGEPLKIEAYETDSPIQVWTFEFTKSRTQMVGYGTKVIPFYDPISGEERPLTETAYIPQTITSTDIIQVIVLDEIVHGWTIEKKEDRKL